MNTQSKVIHLIRHGESVSNVHHTIQGERGYLTPRGTRQAALLGWKLLREPEPIERIITSTAERAEHTGRIIADILHLAPTSSPLFLERKHASRFEGKDRTDPEVARMIREREEYFYDPDFHFEDGEYFPELKARALLGLSYLHSLPETRIALISHGIFGTILALTAMWGDELTPRILDSDRRRISNTGHSILEYGPHRTFSGPAECWVLTQWNDTSHLEGYN